MFVAIRLHVCVYCKSMSSKSFVSFNYAWSVHIVIICPVIIKTTQYSTAIYKRSEEEKKRREERRKSAQTLILVICCKVHTFNLVHMVVQLFHDTV